ncbi:MAG: hypothetical protein ACMVO3_16020 [Thalassobaculum sp.]
MSFETGESDYPRDLVGYGGKPPHAQWPGAARVALSFVLNVEEGSETNVLHGDARKRGRPVRSGRWPTSRGGTRSRDGIAL